MMKRFSFSLLFISALLLLASQCMAREQLPATARVSAFYAALIETMKQGPELGFMGRYEKLKPVITKTFNLQLMTRYAASPAWRKASAKDQKKLLRAFTAFSTATYASRFTKFDGEDFKILGEKEVPSGGIMVETHLTPKDEEPVSLNYLVRKNKKGEYRIVDVYLDATISELATRRADFSAVIKRDGFNKLIVSLDDKARKMGLVAIQ